MRDKRISGIAVIAFVTVSLLLNPAVSHAEQGSVPSSDAQVRTGITPAAWIAPNTYPVTGVPQYLTSPVKAVITPTGPSSVCSMEYDDVTLTAAPWAFNLNPATYRNNYVDVRLCDGEKDYVVFDTSVPYLISTRVIYGGKDAETVELRNTMDADATYTVTTSTGATLLTGTVEGDDAVELAIPTASLKSTQALSLAISGSNNVAMTVPMVYASGWAVFSFSAGTQGMPYQQCETVTWNYSVQGAPAKTATLKRDITSALARISKETNLSFVYVENPADARLTYEWDATLGANGPSAMGGTDGTVQLNPKEWWLTDKYAGFGPWKGGRGYSSGPGGRGWLIVHETMHTMGYEHSDNKKSIMYSVNQGQHKFTADDLDGLHAMYPPGVCPA